MAIELSPRQALAIYYLLLTSKEPAQSELPPVLKKAERQQLVEAGLIHLFKKEKGRTVYVRLTDRGWDWAEENLGVPIGQSKAAAEIQQMLFAKLRDYLHREGLRLFQILEKKPEPSMSDRTEEIRSAYLRLADGNLSFPVLVSQLGQALPNLPLTEFKAQLLHLRAQNLVFFSRRDDPQGITDEDRIYAMHVDGAENHYIAFVK